MPNIKITSLREHAQAEPIEGLKGLWDFMVAIEAQARELVKAIEPAKDRSFAADLWEMMGPASRNDFVMAIDPREGMVGMAMLSFEKAEGSEGVDAHMRYFIVSPQHQNDGVGGRVFLSLVHRARAVNVGGLVADLEYQPASSVTEPVFFYGRHRFRPMRSLGPTGKSRYRLTL